MRIHLVPNYRRTTELASDAMINEGGAIGQPSMREAEAVYARLHKPRSYLGPRWREMLNNPTAMFWTGFATGLAISLLDNHRDEKKA